MNLLADEGVDRQIVASLREAGHSVTYVAEMEAGAPDEEVLDLANREARTLLTADKDFGELAFRRGLLDSGVILVRLPGLTAQSKARIVASVVEGHAAELVPGTFAVVTPGAIRIRRLGRRDG